jgi:hypothetical protein
MAYQFDAFFSYKRDPESDDWHERVKDKLTFWLKQYLGRSDVSIFFTARTSAPVPAGICGSPKR